MAGSDGRGVCGWSESSASPSRSPQPDFVFLIAVLLFGVLTGQMFDALSPSLFYVPLAGTLLITLAAAATVFRASRCDRRQGPLP
jgi:hypothetical protein